MKLDAKSTIEAGKAILGIELGSTRIKAVLIDQENKPIAQGSHTWENLLVDGLWTYSIEAIWSGLQDCYADLRTNVKNAYGIEIETLAAIGVSAMMHGYMPFNKKEETDAIMKKFTDLETDMAAFKEKNGGKSVGILFSYPPSYMQGSGGYLGNMLEKLGYVNVSDKDGQAVSNAQLSMEDLIVANPDLLFAVSPTTKTGDDLKTSYEQEFANNPQTWNQLSAVQNDKVVYLGSIYAKSSGINIIDDIRSLMDQLEQYN